MGGIDREDVHLNFPSIKDSGSVYVSFLVRVDSALTSGAYFIHLANSFPTSNGGGGDDDDDEDDVDDEDDEDLNIPTYVGKIFVRDTVGLGENIQFGLSKSSSSSVEWTTDIYSSNIVYLLVLKYEIVGDTEGNDDIVSLYIDPDITKLEPSVPELINTDTSNDSPIGAIALRQGFSFSQSASVCVDEIVVRPNWFNLNPVELSSFSASVTGNTVTLNWITTTELNNSGFDVLRHKQGGKWEKIAFVDGHGTTTKKQNYSFTDDNLNTGRYAYKLKQVDFNGSFEYSDVVNIEIGQPLSFELFQNFPNPFNPTTTISFQVNEKGLTTLKVYDILGNEVATLVNEKMEAGSYNITYDAASLSSGTYIYQLRMGNTVETKKMILLR
ncbi:MAG: T9SS type A sorting domain-containing protein [Ignavibacterium sp.]|nr:MAG: T9SS type A sorting domain-containing protein [Ignavibacterium sp.]